ncbi:uncharacterized protein LOC129596348 [Paramacrobiotus metropolitanus]|uniref:uncharacterized protein LOC129596348 n=1 Tax=Paramacrobiotus metropolitanus TaxID=2943436 RepID=UPI0024458907|nr:uncharacterized protein LOC129596348 [Paramacrobiotus metropolitanus]
MDSLCILAVILFGIVYSNAVPMAPPHRLAVRTLNNGSSLPLVRPHHPHGGKKEPRHGGALKMTEEERKKHPKFKRHSRGKSRTVAVIPDCFDARQQWPNCQSIQEIRDQGQCNTCWAVSSSSVISDRLCIASGQADQTYVSALHLAACYRPDETPQQICDNPYYTERAYANAAMKGYISGGDSPSVGCAPYPSLPDSAPLNCPADSCTNPDYTPTSPADDMRTDDSYWVHSLSNPKDQAEITQIVKDMQTEIMTNGPVTASVEDWSDWQDWKSTQGAYRGPGDGAKQNGHHAIRIIGWCSDSNGVPYWIIANSWGTENGEQGIYWVERGKNVIGIESDFSGAIIKVPGSCPSSFCTTGIDQIVRLDSSDMNSATYAFNGDCTVQVTIDDNGQITPVGNPVPIGKVFLDAPSGPIVGWDTGDKNDVWLKNPTGSGDCTVVSGASKYSCQAYNSFGGTNVQTVLNGDTYLYDNTSPTWLFKNGNGVNIKTSFTSQFSKVNTILSLSSGNILVCGTRTSSSPVCGTFDTSGKTVSAPASVSSAFTQC